MKDILINKIKKHDNILMIIILLIITSIFLGIIGLNANDELWNFSNINKMSKGLIIYKDINVIITPLYFFIGKIIFNIFGSNYLIYRIYDRIIINIIAFFLTYILFKKLNIKKKNAMIYTTLISISIMIILVSGNYNMLAILFILLGIICQISNTKKKTVKKDILQGIIMFLIFLSKQNIGIYYMLGIILYNILSNSNIKEKIKTLIINFLSAGICLLIFLGYLYINNNLYNFLNYTTAGIGEFAKNNFKFQYSNIIFMIIAIIIEIILIIFTFNKKIKLTYEQKNNIRLLSSISLFTNFIAFPLINLAHTILASICFIILFIYTMDCMILNDILSSKKIEKIKKITLELIIFITLLISLIINGSYIKELIFNKNYYFDTNNPYYGVIASKETIEEINQICNYIKEKNNENIDVKVISYYSNLYMNILNRNNGDMDLPFNGNLGKQGENGLIRKISNLSNTKILILTKEDDYYQESQKVVKYIKQNLEYEGTINRFSIYYIK